MWRVRAEANSKQHIPQSVKKPYIAKLVTKRRSLRFLNYIISVIFIELYIVLIMVVFTIVMV